MNTATIIGVGSAGAVGAAASAFIDWFLERRRRNASVEMRHSRQITVVIHDPEGAERSFTVDSVKLDAEKTIERLGELAQDNEVEGSQPD